MRASTVLHIVVELVLELKHQHNNFTVLKFIIIFPNRWYLKLVVVFFLHKISFHKLIIS